MAQFHFVEDYQRLVADLIAQYSLDEAMARAVGGVGSFEAVGDIECDVMTYAGLRNGMSVIDLGCGSGRLAVALSKRFSIEYCGLDIVQDLLTYAKSRTPANYHYIMNHSLTLPIPAQSVDFFSAFSVFTHLLPAESYLYLEDAMRVLRPGGRVVFSFLEFSNPEHWPSFEGEVNGRRAGQSSHLNMMLDRSAIELWGTKLGFTGLQFVDGREGPWGGHPMWQAVAIMQKP